MPAEAEGGAMRPPIAVTISLSPAFRHTDARGCRHESCSKQPFPRLKPSSIRVLPAYAGMVVKAYWWM
jgi:hypothetical protein